MIGVHNSVTFESSRLTRRIILITIIAVTAVAFECHIARAVSADSKKSLGVPDARQVVSEFKTIVEKIQKGLHNGTYKLVGSDGLAFYVIWINAVEISYDVKETNSLVSPISGVIRIVSKNSANSESSRANFPNKYADTFGKRFVGFATAKDALAAIQPSDFGEPGTSQWEANYAYQDGKWVFVPPKEEGILYDLERYPENQVFARLFLP